MHGIAEAEQIFGEIGAVLPGNTGEECNAPFRILNRHINSNNALDRAVTAAKGADWRTKLLLSPGLAGQIGRATGFSPAAQAIAFDPGEV
jgi:hypothetical protein